MWIKCKNHNLILQKHLPKIFLFLSNNGSDFISIISSNNLLKYKYNMLGIANQNFLIENMFHSHFAKQHGSTRVWLTLMPVTSDINWTQSEPYQNCRVPRRLQLLVKCYERPGHTALYGLITAKTRQKVVSREADDVVRVDVEFKTSSGRFIDVAGRGGKSEQRRTRQKVFNWSKF